jgi:hypothetical protein
MPRETKKKTLEKIKDRLDLLEDLRKTRAERLAEERERMKKLSIEKLKKHMPREEKAKVALLQGKGMVRY